MGQIFIFKPRSSSSLLTYDLEYLLPPVLPSDINVTVVTNELMSLKVQSNPPATNYSVINSNLPSGLNFNNATGILSGTPTGPTGSYSISITASNARGSASTSINLSYEASLSTPIISAGFVIEVEGRSASIEAELVSSGGKANQVTLYYGKMDGGENNSSWGEVPVDLGSLSQGKIPYKFKNLESGATHYYRLKSENTDHSAWSNPGTFTTLSYDQGIFKV